jgi:hypothetical protein
MYPGHAQVQARLDEPLPKMHGWSTMYPELRGMFHRVVQAERHVRQVHPPVIAAILIDELQSWRDFGHRLDDGRRIRKLTDEILGPVPAPDPVIASNVA